MKEFLRSLEGSKLTFVVVVVVYFIWWFLFLCFLWYGKTRGVSGVNRSIGDEYLHVLNVIYRLKHFFSSFRSEIFFFKFQI